MTYHTIPLGRHDADPGHGHRIRRRVRRIDFDFDFTTLRWFHPTESRIGRDGLDWLKLCGVSYFSPWRPSTWPKNVHSALVGFRPGVEPDTWEVAPYANGRDGSNH